jgi:hypothetical protein
MDGSTPVMTIILTAIAALNLGAGAALGIPLREYVPLLVEYISNSVTINS